MIARLKHDQGGFTLVELLIASSLATVIMLAAFALIDSATSGQRRVEARVDAATRGRNAMELITRQLRAQVCLGKGKTPMYEATDNRTTFHASVAPAPSNPSAAQVIQRRTLEYVPDGTTGRGSIVETVIDSKTPLPNPDWTGTPRVRTLVTNIAPVAGVPIFRFYKFDPLTAPNTVLLTPPVSDTNKGLIVQVRTTFEAFPDMPGPDGDKVKTRLDNKVTVRTADPNDPTHSPKCI